RWPRCSLPTPCDKGRPETQRCDGPRCLAQPTTTAPEIAPLLPQVVCARGAWNAQESPGTIAFGRAPSLDHRLGHSLALEGTGALCVRESLVTILSPFSSRYIATTIVRSWSALGRITDPSGVRSLVPSVRVISVPVSSTLCT